MRKLIFHYYQVVINYDFLNLQQEMRMEVISVGYGWKEIRGKEVNLEKKNNFCMQHNWYGLTLLTEIA